VKCDLDTVYFAHLLLAGLLGVLYVLLVVWMLCVVSFMSLASGWWEVGSYWEAANLHCLHSKWGKWPWDGSCDKLKSVLEARV